MSNKPNLLVVGNYNRQDFVDLFKHSNRYFNFYFLEFTSKKEEHGSYFQKYGKSIFWGNFNDTFELLAHVKPSKVVFFFIESYFHVALNIACKVKGIKTLHLDHGLRDININIRLEKHIIPQEKQLNSPTTLKKIQQLYPRIKARLFLINTISKLPPHEAAFLKQYIKVRKKTPFIETFKIITSPLRVADVYLAFSRKVYEAHQKADHLPDKHKVYFIGIPTYDHLYKISPLASTEHAVIFIDQGLAARGILGWNQDAFDFFKREFLDICLKLKINLFVKLHPVQSDNDRFIWSRTNNVTVMDDLQLTQQLSKTRIIVGFCSTYLLPLIAMEHTTVIILENHPAGKLDVSKSFIDAGVAHPVYTMQELEWALQNIDQLHQQQLPNKANFTDEWLYKFDGKSGERLRDILLKDDI